MHVNRIRPICGILLVFILIAGLSLAAAEKTILMSFTGDCTIGSEERTRGAEDSFDSLAASKGYDYFFANFKDMFSQDDLTVINFEGVLSDSKSQESKGKTYRFRGPTVFAKILTGSSIEACSLANNHIADFGKQGEDSTKAALTENGIAWFQAFNVYTFEKDGVKIAFMALDNISYNKYSEKLRNVIREMKSSGAADAFVVCWHTGMEYRGTHEENAERMVKNVINAGADLIIINHPHVLQGIGIYNNRCVFYSLGNFVFGGNNRIKDKALSQNVTVTSLYSMVVQVKMTFTDDGRYLGQQATLYPVYISSGGMDKHNVQINNYQPYRADVKEAVPVRAAVQYDTLFKLPEITADEDGLSRMEMGFLPALDGLVVSDSEDGGYFWTPEAASPKPGREEKGNPGN